MQTSCAPEVSYNNTAILPSSTPEPSQENKTKLHYTTAILKYAKKTQTNATTLYKGAI